MCWRLHVILARVTNPFANFFLIRVLRFRLGFVGATNFSLILLHCDLPEARFTRVPVPKWTCQFFSNVLPYDCEIVGSTFDRLICGILSQNHPGNPSLSTPPPHQDLLQQKVPPVAALGPVRLRVRLPGLLARRPRPREGRLVPHRDRQARTEVRSGESPFPRTTLQIFFF